MKEEVLILTHKVDKSVKKLFKRIKSTSGNRKVSLLFHGKSCKSIPKPNYCFLDDIIKELGYPTISEGLIPGHAHFPLFWYYKKFSNPDVDNFWFIEYDVRFTGKWKVLFDYYSDSKADLITSYIRNYRNDPDWGWWEIKHPQKLIKKENRVASFNPIYRISKEALQFLDLCFLNGFKGHNEVLFATLLKNSGFKLQDMGCNSELTLGNKNKFYYRYSLLSERIALGSMRYRPVFNKAGIFNNMLYHPVKPDANKGGFLNSLQYYIRELQEAIKKLAYTKYMVFKKFIND